MLKRFSNIIGFDDAPFPAAHRGKVTVVGAVCARTRINGILVGSVRRDGSDAAQKLAQLVAGSKFARSVQLIMLQGVALAGFNVVDVFTLHEQLDLPVLVVCRKQPDMQAVREALVHIRGGAKKWSLIEKLGPMEPAAGVYVQRAGLTLAQAAAAVEHATAASAIPEPLRVAHLVAGALATGQSSGRV